MKEETYIELVNLINKRRAYLAHIRQRIVGPSDLFPISKDIKVDEINQRIKEIERELI